MSEQRLVIFIPVAIFGVGIATLVFARLLIRNADNKTRRLEAIVEDPTPPGLKPCGICGARTSLVCVRCDRHLCPLHITRIDEEHPCSWAKALACTSGDDT